jgi:hypothetical protein
VVFVRSAATRKREKTLRKRSIASQNQKPTLAEMLTS